MRALRPDGICYKAICGTEAWREYVSNRTVPSSESFEGAGPITPIFFVLSPGMGPLKGSLGKKLGYTVRTSTIYHWGKTGRRLRRQQWSQPPRRSTGCVYRIFTWSNFGCRHCKGNLKSKLMGLIRTTDCF